MAQGKTQSIETVKDLQQVDQPEFTVVSDPELASLDLNQKTLMNFIDETMDADEIRDMVVSYM